MHAREHRAQREQGRGIELGAVMHVERRGAARRQTLLDQGVELLRQQVKRDVAALEGIDQDQVVAVLAAVEEHAAVARMIAHARRFDHAEILLRGLDHAGIDLDGVDRASGMWRPR